jgi:hypothetical protein
MALSVVVVAAPETATAAGREGDRDDNGDSEVSFI